MKFVEKNIPSIQAYADVQAQEYFDWASLPICSLSKQTTLDSQKITPKFGILLVAYGSSHFQGSSALRFFQSRMEKYFSVPIRLAFTSETMRKRLAHAKTKSDSVLKALEKMNFERFTHVAVQSLHLIPGTEYYDVLGDIKLAKESIPLKIETGLPLLSKEEDVPFVAKALLSLIPENFAACDKILWMGHGTLHESERYYEHIAHAVHALDSRLHIACMTGVNTLETVLAQWNIDFMNCCDKNCVAQKEIKREKIWLLPLLTVIGKHALHDMAGEQESSWKSCLEKAGYVCEAHLHGLAESESIQDIWIERLCIALHKF